jgi:hypothetical protein
MERASRSEDLLRELMVVEVLVKGVGMNLRPRDKALHSSRVGV